MEAHCSCGLQVAGSKYKYKLAARPSAKSPLSTSCVAWHWHCCFLAGVGGLWSAVHRGPCVCCTSPLPRASRLALPCLLLGLLIAYCWRMFRSAKCVRVRVVCGAWSDPVAGIPTGTETETGNGGASRQSTREAPRSKPKAKN
jgi:hypothetical protein